MPFDPSKNNGGGYSNYGNPYMKNQMPSQKKSNKNLIIVIVALVIIVFLGIGAFIFASKTGLVGGTKTTPTVATTPEYKEIELIDDASTTPKTTGKTTNNTTTATTTTKK